MIMITTQRQAISVANCPLKLRVCSTSCYWYKKSKCIFPPEGYDNLGRPVKKREGKGAKRRK